MACEAPVKKRVVPAASIGRVTEKMTELMVHDITNPPLAARFYAYACLSAYETIAISNEEYPSFYGFLNKLPPLTKPSLKSPSLQISVLFAMLHTASSMQPSGAEIDTYRLTLIDSCKSWDYAEKEISEAKQYAEEISKQILNYAQNDQYREKSNYPRYQPSEGAGKWYPTPPGYFAPVEPYFNTVRPFTLKAADQFKPLPPVEFSTDPRSEFYDLMNEVYSLEMNKEQREIAAIWDCNPFALEETCHLMVGIKQISPGVHWMGITAIACEQSNLNFEETIKINSLVSIGLMDGFISCWNEKYRSDRIRPETAIRKTIDPTYPPMLQTPPFPEYISGHSKKSTTEAVILTHFFGDDYSYTDIVEVQFGLGSSDFRSFMHASEEASISRLYGGIHKMDAISRGQDQGKQIGNWIFQSYQGHLDQTKLR